MFNSLINLLTKIIPVLAPLAFIPPICIFIWIRNLEKHGKEFWEYIVLSFVWGASIAVFMSFVIENTINTHLMDILLLTIIIAPIVEETFKPVALRIVKKQINEIEDGLIFGAIAGLGFASTENLIYGTIYWQEGFIVLLSLFYTRTIGTGLLHASTTALTGYGYSKMLLKKKKIISIIPYFLLAILAHSLFNFFAFSSQISDQIIGVVLATVFAVSLMMWVHKKIKYHDKRKLKIRSHPAPDSS